MTGHLEYEILSHLPGVVIVAAADPHGDVHQVTRDVPVVATVEELLQHRIDYCVVAAPTAHQAPVRFTLAGAGIPSLIEKPIAPDVVTALALAGAFDDAGVIGAVGHTERYSAVQPDNPALQSMRARLADSGRGQLY